MKKLAIIGASYLQEPLIRQANEMGIETHVFAWAANDVGEKIASVFYPISIVEKEEILAKCREIGIDGICSIASDLAAITVNYVAEQMGLVGNSAECVKVSTNKHDMRQQFEKNGDPSPKSIRVENTSDLDVTQLVFPVIVKPLDRSGSRGITKLYDADGLEEAIENAKSVGFEKYALVEEFAEGTEYSVEYISEQGKHTFLAVTRKYTTGSPHFIETGHIEPAGLTDEMQKKVQQTVAHALDSLMIQNGASHSELKIDSQGNIRIIEIGGRMGGDCIGSSLVRLSTGYDFVKAVIEIALSMPVTSTKSRESSAAVRFIFSKEDVEVLDAIKRAHPEILVEEDVHPITDEAVVDSSTRFGYYLLASDDRELLASYMPKEIVND